jgi:hypothetical protein
MPPHLVRFNNGDEFDAMTKGGRRVHRFRAGTRAQIKRKFRRRERRAFKAARDQASAASA